MNTWMVLLALVGLSVGDKRKRGILGGYKLEGPGLLGRHITIHNKHAVPVPLPYPVPVERLVLYPVPRRVPIPVDAPVPVPVPHPYPVPLIREVALHVEQPYPLFLPQPYPLFVPRGLNYQLGVPKATQSPPQPASSDLLDKELLSKELSVIKEIKSRHVKCAK